MTPRDVKLHSGMGPAILDYLSTMETLPAFGCVAGQAVASAIDNLYGRGGGVFNDIDVFIPVEHGKKTGSPKASKPPARFTPKFAEGEAYGEMQKFLLQVGTYELASTARRGLVNCIYITMTGDLRKNDQSLRVISSFDLNCTRVAVDLRSKQLRWDHHFEHYLRTRELRIVTAHTPVHTFLRLLKKQQELAEVTVDLETAARASFVMQDALLKPELRRSGAASFIFGEKYRAMAEAVKTAWAPYYDWDDAWLHLASSSEDRWVEGAGDETTTDAVNLYTLRPRGHLEEAYSEAARKLGVASVVLLPPRMYAEREAYRRTVVNGAKLALEISSPPESCRHVYQMARGADYLFGLPQSVNWSDLDAFLASSLGRTTYGQSAVDQWGIVEGLNVLQKSLGVPDGLQVVLDGWDSAKSLEPEKVILAAQALLEKERQPAIEQPPPETPEKLQLDPSQAPVKIQHIRTPREFKELSAVLGPLQPAGMWGAYFLLLDDGLAQSLLVCPYSLAFKKPTGGFTLTGLSAPTASPSPHHQMVAQAILAGWRAADATTGNTTAAATV